MVMVVVVSDMGDDCTVLVLLGWLVGWLPGCLILCSLCTVCRVLPWVHAKVWCWGRILGQSGLYWGVLGQIGAVLGEVGATGLAGRAGWPAGPSTGPSTETGPWPPGHLPHIPC